jgi:hypothetical protein
MNFNYKKEVFMKKLFFSAIALLAMFSFSSCESEDMECFEIKMEASKKSDNNTNVNSISQTFYEWNTMQGVKAQIKEAKNSLVQEGYYDIKVTKKKVDKDESSCAAANIFD